MSETPRTDQIMKFSFGDDREYVTVEFARKLESELTNVTNQWNESVGVLAALLHKVTDIRGIDMELYAPKEIEAAEKVIKKIKEKIL